MRAQPVPLYESASSLPELPRLLVGSVRACWSALQGWKGPVSGEEGEREVGGGRRGQRERRLLYGRVRGEEDGRIRERCEGNEAARCSVVNAQRRAAKARQRSADDHNILPGSVHSRIQSEPLLCPCSRRKPQGTLQTAGEKTLKPAIAAEGKRHTVHTLAARLLNYAGNLKQNKSCSPPTASGTHHQSECS